MREQGFDGPVVTEWCEDNHRDMLVFRDLTYWDKSGQPHSIYKGDRINGKSTPRIFWSGYLGGSPYTGPSRKAAPIHDKERGMAKAAGGAAGKAMRKRADHTFREMMEFLGVKIVKRNVMFWAVRVGGMFSTLAIATFIGCSTIERTIRHEHDRKIEKVARPVAREEAQKAVTELKAEAVDFLGPLGTGAGGTGGIGLLLWMLLRKKAEKGGQVEA